MREMHPIGHWAVGFILGTLILLPFLFDRMVYNYDLQKWESVSIRKPPRGIKSTVTQRNHVNQDLIPVTRSRFLRIYPPFATTCGILSMLPDLGALYGDNKMDNGGWSDLFFYHRWIDFYSHSHEISLEPLLFAFAILLGMTVMLIAWKVQIRYEIF